VTPPASGSRSPGAPALGWLGWASFSAALAAIPLTAVRYPPVLDLPQLLAQIDLLRDVFAGPPGPYRIQWWAPDKIAYLPLALGRWLGDDAWGPRLALVFVALAWIAGVFALARRRRRAPVQAALACCFLWCGTFYGGFFHFLLGILALAFWLPELAAEPQRTTWLALAARTFAGAALLYLCHALWFAAGLAALPVALALRRARPREWWSRAVGAAPVALVAALWFPSLARSGWSSTLEYGMPIAARLGSPVYFVMGLFGGVRGGFEPLAAGALAVWLAVGAWTSRRRPGSVDRVLLITGAAALAAALLLPEALGETALFGPRWGWVGGVCLVLAVPPPQVRPALRATFAALLLVSFSAGTWARWWGYGQHWTSGFERVLAPIGRGERVLELDFVRHAPSFYAPTFFHMAAYAEVERGARIGYSFAETPSSLVVLRELPARHEWTPWLRKQPERLAASDLDYFDWLLVLADAGDRERLESRFPRLVERAAAGPWRLYGTGATPSAAKGAP
jgi:hypothetical protein